MSIPSSRNRVKVSRSGVGGSPAEPSASTTEAVTSARSRRNGPSALSVANGRILRETAFDEVYIQPSAGDGGGAIGAALYAYHTVLGNPRRFVMEHAYWGEEHSLDVTERFLRRENLPGFFPFTSAIKFET